MLCTNRVIPVCGGGGGGCGGGGGDSGARQWVAQVFEERSAYNARQVQSLSLLADATELARVCVKRAFR